jgi:hypothetical protein
VAAAILGASVLRRVRRPAAVVEVEAVDEVEGPVLEAARR